MWTIKNIQPEYRNRIWKGIELPDQEIIRTEANKYEGIEEEDAIKQAERNKQEKSISEEREYSKQNSATKISSNGRTLRRTLSGKILWNFLKIENTGRLTNGPKNKKVDDVTLGR